MYEQSSRFRALEEILDHPTNRDRDAHERHALYQRLRSKNYDQLTEERRGIAVRNYE